MPNIFLIWFRLFVSNDSCRCISGFGMLLSFAIPVTWVFSFILVCRAAQAAGADEYGSQLGVTVAYAAVCLAAWAAIFLPGLVINLCANCNQRTAPESPPSPRAERRAIRRAAKEAATPSPETASPSSEAATKPANLPFSENTCTAILFVTILYFAIAIILAPGALLGVIPVIILRTSSYSSALGYSFIFAGIYAAGVAALYAAPWIIYASCHICYWMVAGFWNHCISTCREAKIESEAFAKV